MFYLVYCKNKFSMKMMKISILVFSPPKWFVETKKNYSRAKRDEFLPCS